MTDRQTASAAASGASATERFKSDKPTGVADTPQERVDLLAREVLDAVHATIRKHKVTYDEYNALKAWLIGVGQDGEWPLFLDVWVEHVVEEVATEHRQGSKGTIEGPYYVPGSPEQSARGHAADARERGRHPAAVPGSGHQRRRHHAPGRQGRDLARRRRRLLLPVRPRHPRVEPARHVRGRRRGPLRDPHDPSRRRTRSPPTAPAAS